METIQMEIINLVIAIFVALAGFVTKHVVTYLKQKGFIAKLTANKELVKIVVGAVEQTYKHLHGEEKFNMAKIELAKYMNEKKVKMTEKEIDLLIESAVKKMKDTATIELKNDTES